MCLAVSFAQQPGLTVTDTRIDLSVNPSLFLQRATQVFTGTGDLGHVQSGQFVGYLFPMGPYYALTHALGFPTWIAQRLWLAIILFAAAYGVVRLLDVLLGPKRSSAHAVAAVLYAINPFVIVFISRATVSLIALAILPWTMLAVARGIHNPKSWRWPAVIGLLAAISAGGVNAAQLAWVMLGPVGLLVWEATAGKAGWSAARSFTARALVCGVAGAIWWIVPVVLQGAYGGDFLKFTEQPTSIWATTSMSESLRLLGYWPMYLGTGYGQIVPAMRIGQTYLFDSVVVVASFVIPGTALLGLRTTRRWFYAPFFGLLACVTLAAMCAGFPNGTAFGHVLSWGYAHVPTLDFLRTPYKAAPVVALSIAVLGGLAARELIAYTRRRARPAPPAAAATEAPVGRRVRIRRRIQTSGRYMTAPAVGLALLAFAAAVWALPLFTNHAIDRRLAYGSVPKAWPKAINAAGRAAGDNHRTMILPGELFGDYIWGRTWDSLAPALARYPVAIRQSIRYADPRSAQLLEEIDDTVQQARLVPGQLPALMGLIGVRQVLVPSDALDSQSGGLDAATTAGVLSGQPGFSKPVATYGPSRIFLPASGRDGPARSLPEIRRYGAPGGPGLVHVDASGPATIVDGGPGALVELAADGQLRPSTPTFYAGDVGTKQLDAFVSAGARLVFSDSNRRQVVAPTYVRQDLGPTLTATAPIPTDAATWNPFPADGLFGQTVARYNGLADLTSPQPVGSQLFPAFRPEAALDGDLGTAWLPDPSLPNSQYWMQVKLAAPRPVGTITVVPKPVDGISPLWVAISVNGGPEREYLLKAGLNQIPIDVLAVRTLRFRLTHIDGTQLLLGAGGLSEISIPGVTPIRETLVLPSLLPLATSHLNTSHDEMAIALTRTTADFPTRAGKDQGIPLARSEIAATDPETGMRRALTLPAARRFSIGGWATVSPTAPDNAIDALTGSLPGWSLTSSSRFEGAAGARASSAIDHDPATSWIGDVVPSSAQVQFGQDTSVLPLAAAGELLSGYPGAHQPRWGGGLQAPLPYWSIAAPHPVELRSLRLLPGPARYAFPDVVELVTKAGASGPLGVRRGGLVTLPRPVRTSILTIRILHVRPPTGRFARRLLRAVAIREVISPFHPPTPRRAGPLVAKCGALAIAGPDGFARMTVSGTVQEIDQDSALRLSGCGLQSTLALPAGGSTITAPAGVALRPDHLLLDSPAPVPLPHPPAGTATSGGLTVTGIPHGADVHTTGAGWLVLGESYSRGWRAYCSGNSGPERSLGAPVPIDGYANGWAIGPGCVHVRFAYGPQTAANIGYIISLLALPALLALAFIPRRRRRLAQPAPLHQEVGTGDPFVKLTWLGSLAVGTAATIAIGFLFGIPLGPLAVPIFKRGTSARRLFTIGGTLLLLVPIAYLVRSAPNAGGYDFGYAYDNLLGHWLAVGGVCAIFGGCVLQLLPLLRRGPRPPISSSAAPPRPVAEEPERQEAAAASSSAPAAVAPPAGS